MYDNKKKIRCYGPLKFLLLPSDLLFSNRLTASSMSSPLIMTSPAAAKSMPPLVQLPSQPQQKWSFSKLNTNVALSTTSICVSNVEASSSQQLPICNLVHNASNEKHKEFAMRSEIPNTQNLTYPQLVRNQNNPSIEVMETSLHNMLIGPSDSTNSGESILNSKTSLGKPQAVPNPHDLVSPRPATQFRLQNLLKTIRSCYQSVNKTKIKCTTNPLSSYVKNEVSNSSLDTKFDENSNDIDLNFHRPDNITDKRLVFGPQKGQNYDCSDNISDFRQIRSQVNYDYKSMNASIDLNEIKILANCSGNIDQTNKKKNLDGLLVNDLSIKTDSFLAAAGTGSCNNKVGSPRKSIVSHLPRAVVEGLKAVTNAIFPTIICLDELLPIYKVRSTTKEFSMIIIDFLY